MFIQSFNFSILAYISTTISLWNHILQFKNTVRPVIFLAHLGKLLLKISINYLYVYSIFVEYLRYKVLIFCLCRSFGGNSLLILTTLPYDSNYAIQGGCKLVLKLYITDLYAYCIFLEYLSYKVLIFCLCGSFGGNSLLILTTLPYNSNSAIQEGLKINLFIHVSSLNIQPIGISVPMK